MSCFRVEPGSGLARIKRFGLVRSGRFSRFSRSSESPRKIRSGSGAWAWVLLPVHCRCLTSCLWPDQPKSQSAVLLRQNLISVPWNLWRRRKKVCRSGYPGSQPMRYRKKRVRRSHSFTSMSLADHTRVQVVGIRGVDVCSSTW